MQLNLEWHDWTGLVGVALVLLSFFLLQTGTLRGDRLVYQLMNLFGAIGLLISLAFKPNVPSIVIQIAWILISVYGIVRGIRGRGRGAVQPPLGQPYAPPDASSGTGQDRR